MAPGGPGGPGEGAPDIQTLLASLNSSGKGTASARTSVRR